MSHHNVKSNGWVPLNLEPIDWGRVSQAADRHNQAWIFAIDDGNGNIVYDSWVQTNGVHTEWVEIPRVT